MGEVLSQNEIDSLLQALSTGELDVESMPSKEEKQVKNYDFKRPAKFSKEHLRTLEIIFEHYGRLLSTNLPVYLRRNIQVDVASAESVTFSEFTNGLSNPVILGIVNFAPLNGNIILEMNPNLGFAMIDRMLGGQGNPLGKNRDFSDIELSILEKILIICTNLIREPWRNVLDVNPMLERIETNAQFAQIIPPSDMIAIVTINLKVGDVEGLMNICLPFFTLESIMDKLNTKFWFANMQDVTDEDYEEYIATLIKRVDIPMKAVLGRSSIAVSDFVSLMPGDIIRLDTKTDADLNVYVGNIKKFKALPGSSNDKYAIQVTEVLREE
ncbi:MAG: flagellar motor switch protein FliM [Lachnospiraceae bacterium]|nr:flagellar motor switch protein FliM [Lachnospiraceae bacterium]MBR3684494.1 flagellar motor switch protein FliM [Lachnospiraceae bacterium]